MKNLLQKEYEKIEVPKDDVLKSIQIGMKRAGGIERNARNKKRVRPILISTAAAATLLLSSSFLSPNVSRVMADVPMLGGIYETFNDMVGRNLESQKLITELNETSSSRGIDVTITNAYYDGAVIGVTFDVKGNVKTEDGRAVGFYEIFGGAEHISDSKELVYMERTDSGFTGHIQLSYPKTDLPSYTTLPLKFLTIGGKEGSWKFDVPIEQLPYKTITVNEETTTENGDVKVLFDTIIEGKASTAIHYTATFPSVGTHDQVRLEVFDDKGEPIQIKSDGIDLETTKENDGFIVKGRSMIQDVLRGKTAYVDIIPSVALYEPDQYVDVTEQVPFHVISDRQDLSVTVEKISIEDKQVTFDFQVNNGDDKDLHMSFYENFARNDVLLVNEDKKETYEKPLKHSVETLDKKKLRFRSTFDISKFDDFKMDQFVLRVNLNSLSNSLPVELEKVRVNLK
ncbi:DUF4179 domain-containing protein [Bacillus timonensis]|nr:DUF4179 domain-containing protein [Bacillus timonensis]